MNQLNDQDLNCLICYENLRNKKSVLFEECGHTLCPGCTNEIIFTKFPKCPIDTKNILNIHDGMTMTKSLAQYQYYLLASNEYSTCDSVKNYLLEVIEISECFVNEIIITLSINLETLEKWLLINPDIPKFEINFLKDSLLDLDIFNKNLLEDMIDMKPYKIIICEKFIKDNPDINLFPHNEVYTDVKLIYDVMHNFSLITYSEKINIPVKGNNHKTIHATYSYLNKKLEQVKPFKNTIDALKLKYSD